MKKTEFERILSKAFWDLENKHGFRKSEDIYHKGGVIVRFENTTTEISLNYEIGILPWLTIAEVNEIDSGRVSLDWLLVELGVKKSPTTDEAFFPAKMDEGQLGSQLKEKTDQLFRYGADFLKGDFTLMPNLKKRAEDYLTECKKFAEQKKSRS